MEIASDTWRCVEGTSEVARGESGLGSGAYHHAPDNPAALTIALDHVLRLVYAQHETLKPIARNASWTAEPIDRYCATSGCRQVTVRCSPSQIT